MKNLLLSLAMLLSTVSIYAQLTVKPTASNDTYIYVSDQVLYVEQDVNLTENSFDPTTEASIYLRNESQLIQGDGVSGVGDTNTGTGYISVFQESNSDSYDYNYWCSPVGNPNNTGNRAAGLIRLYDSLSVTNATRSLTTNNVNGSSSPLTVSKRWTYKWDIANQNWQPTGGGSSIPPGYGFTMKGTDVTSGGVPETQNQRYDFRGRPNNGDITLPTQTGVPFVDGNVYNFTFAGNPYPSALDLNLVMSDPANSEIDSFRFWDEDRTINSHYYVDNKGGYGTWIPGLTPYADGGNYTQPTFIAYDNAGNPIGGMYGTGADTERLFAPVGQGFMIVANSTGSITIKNSHRAYQKEGSGNYSEFRNQANSLANTVGGGGNLEITPQIRIHTYFGEGTHFRDMLLLFHDSATDGYDSGLDATHPMDGVLAEAYFTIGDAPDDYTNLVIQTVPFTPTKLVPIAFTLEQQTKFSVKAVEEIITPFDNAYLYDSLNDTYKPITGGKEATTLLPAGTYEDRFFIAFRGNFNDDDTIGDFADNVNNTREITNVDVLQNNPSSQLELINPDEHNIKQVLVYDMAGKMVLMRRNVGTIDRISFPTAHVSDGIYLVKVTTEDDLTMDYKVSIFNK
ncbi:MAG: T9SS type A sorting domain-containing protein [Flavobacteriaceae bacterium]|nr:T9SS type A sorting domain-containing protein [Flavobacteriaceae bacterium]